MHKSTKLFDGFSCCFRQWKAKETHCRFLHGYGISFRVTFDGMLDHRNWVWDFGGMKRAKTKIDGKSPKEWMDYVFDHTCLIEKDDPQLESFQMMEELGLLHLRVMDVIGAEACAKLVFDKFNERLALTGGGRVKVVKVECWEADRNSSIYTEI